MVAVDEWLPREIGIGGDMSRGDWCIDCLLRIRSVDRLVWCDSGVDCTDDSEVVCERDFMSVKRECVWV